MAVVNKKSVMMLYTGVNDLYSHRTRIVLAEKGVAVDIIDPDHIKNPEDIADLNPYGTLPILVDRSLVIYESRIIMEYLDERFPHPPLLPVYPVKRAKYRLMLYRIERDWYSLLHRIESGSEPEKRKARQELKENLINVAIVFSETPYFLSEEFTLLDCCMAPILWRLPVLGITLPKSAVAVEDYAKRLFERPSFQLGLTETERELHLKQEE